jgi:hypothetical protein
MNVEFEYFGTVKPLRMPMPLRNTGSTVPSSQESERLRGYKPGEDVIGSASEMPLNQLSQNRTKVCSYRKVAAFIELIGIQTGPLPVNFPTVHRAT